MSLLFLSAFLPAPSSFSFVRIGRRASLTAPGVAFTTRGFSPYRRIFQARLRSSLVDGDVQKQVPTEGSEIIFLGTGTSEGIPRVCSKANEPGNKNKRLNTSILIRYASSFGRQNILVDAGKFFYHSALQWFPYFGSLFKLKTLYLEDFGCVAHPNGGSRLRTPHFLRVRTIDAVVITHSHADAIGGLDDLRDWTNNVQPQIPIYVAKRDFEVMKKTHYYLVDTSVIIPGAAVSELQFNIISEAPFIVKELKVTPLPVWHGQGYRSLGFRFGNVCYISDVSDIPEETYPLLKGCELLILDALRPDRSSSTHFGLPRALEEVRKIQPKRTLFTGMMHLMDHDKVNQDLVKLMETEGLDIQLSYDGLRLPLYI